MICPQCGVEVVGESVYCHKCGHRLDMESAPAATTTAKTDTDGPAASSERLRPLPTGRGDEPERDLWTGGYSPRAMLGHWIGAGILTLAAIVVGVLVGGAIWWAILILVPLLWLALGGMLAYRRLNVAYRLTNHRFFHQTGILRRVTDRIEVIDLDDVTLVQGPIDRMLNVGAIKVTSTDRTHPEFWLRGIDQVQEVYQLFDDARRAERLRRGLRIETH